MSDTSHEYRPGRVIAGRYRIVSPLSKGGMGAVYLAQQVSLGRDVALKVILEPGSDPELLKRFDVEARAVCQLKHPNIITYHDYGRDTDGHPFLVMEYLAGYSGTKLVYGDRRPGLLDLVHVVAQVCSALHEAHAKGIIHRDLKWSNIMVCPQSHDPYFTKLIDFGIMKVATDGSSGDQRALTRTGMLLGTPEYMSPEAICGMPIDGRADQYSLAIMVWEALEGRRPFDAPSHFELLRRQVQDEPPPFSNAVALLETYPDVGATVLRAMEKHPDDRFEDILAFQQSLMLACGLIIADPTAPGRPAARRITQPRARNPGTAPIGGVGGQGGRSSERLPNGGRPKLANGMPVSRSRLPAAALEGPRPVDTHVKTGSQQAEKAPRRLHWAWMVAAFLLFLGIGFGGVAALISGTREEAAPTSGLAVSPDVVSTPAEDVAVAAADDTSAPAEIEVAPVARVAASEAALVADTVVAPEVERVAVAPPDVADEPPVADVSERADVVERSAAVEPGDVVEPANAVSRAAAGHVAAAEGAAASAAADPKSASAAVEAPKVKAAPGQLFVQVDPWGNVAIDGRPKGRAPFEGELRPGVHTVTVTNSFFEGSYTFRIKVEPGKRVARTVVLADHLEKIE